jgi:hypothetical protein
MPIQYKREPGGLYSDPPTADQRVMIEEYWKQLGRTGPQPQPKTGAEAYEIVTGLKKAIAAVRKRFQSDRTKKNAKSAYKYNRNKWDLRYRPR